MKLQGKEKVPLCSVVQQFTFSVIGLGYEKLSDELIVAENSQQIYSVFDDFMCRRPFEIDSMLKAMTFSEFLNGLLPIDNNHVTHAQPFGHPDPGSVERGKPTYKHSYWTYNDMPEKLQRNVRNAWVDVDWDKLWQDVDNRYAELEKKKHERNKPKQEPLYQPKRIEFNDEDRSRDEQFAL